MSWFQNKIGDPNNFLHQKCFILVGKLGLFFDHLFDGQLGPPQNAHIYIYTYTHIHTNIQISDLKIYDSPKQPRLTCFI